MKASFSPRVAAKLFTMLREIHEQGPLKKDGTNSEQHYKYLSERQIKEVVQPLLVKHGLLFLPLGQRITGTGVTPKGTQRITDVSVQYAWVDAETGEYISGEFIGSGTDSNDKGVYKALTGGGKQLMCNTFQIPSGDDPERDGGSGERRRPERASTGERRQNPDAIITEGQQKRMFALMRAGGKTADHVRAILGSYGYEHSNEVKARDYDAICADIQA